MSGRRIVFGGAFARVPYQGGLAWLVLQWVLGLRQLGHEVLLLEPLAGEDLRPAGAALADSENAAWFRGVIHTFGLTGQAALYLANARDTLDLSPQWIAEWAAEADLLIDIAGGLAGAEWLPRIPLRLYLDVDPGFTQLWHAREGIDMRLDRYTDFATVGLTFAAHNGVPDCGRRWVPTAQPVVLEEWPVAARLTRPALTTVANWRGYGSLEVDGEIYGQKAHSLRDFIGLPRECDVRCQLALAIDPGEIRDVAALAANGWDVLDPRAVAGSPEDYREFVQGSWAELGVAKSGYVKAQGGWFSDRSACYLASGRPVIAQDTGLAGALPLGAGLFTFSTMEDICAAVDELRRDYGAHRRAAREIAEQHFGSGVVLGKLLDRLGAAA
jgi:hypothetical protein